jgi:hypothetical protein
MNPWHIAPFVGIGWLRFGQERSETQSLLGEEPETFYKASRALVDEYRGRGLHLYFDQQNRLEFIEAFAPCNPTYEGVPLLGRELESVRRDLEAIGIRCEVDEIGLECAEIGVGLTVGDALVNGVAIYRRGYYETEQVAAR